MSIFRPRTAIVETTIPTQGSRTASLTVTPPDAVCRLEPRGDRLVPAIIATGSGHQAFALPADLPAWGADLTVSAAGYDTWHGWVTLPTTDTEWPAVTLTRTVVELPRLVRRGQFYYRQDDAPFTVIEASQFRAYERFLSGEDLSPVFGQLQSEGFNTIRVWLLNTSVGHIVPAEHPDFYARLQPFLMFAARFGLYVELTVFTQTQSLMPRLADQQAHYDQTVTALGATFCFVEPVNEADVHDNAHDPSLRLWKPDGATFDLCSGSNGSDAWVVQPVLDSTRYHSNDAPEWWRRQAHNGMEMGAAFGVPNIANENTRPDHDPTPHHFEDAAAGAALLSAGSCFHSESGKHARLMDDLDLTCAQAFVRGVRSVDLSMRTSPYVHRTDLEGPGILRVYQRGTAIVIIRQ